MTALELRLKIKRLMQKHQTFPTPIDIPLTAPTDHAMILEGYASTADIDLDRVKFRGWAFPILPWAKDFVPLLYKHDPAQIAGRIESLEYDDKGALKISARVDHPLARRCGAFSVGAKVIAYEMKNADRPDFYAIVTQAELTEVSLTDVPANPQALVKHRYRVSPRAQYYELTKQRVACLMQLATLLKEQRA